jgi:Fe-S-cluster containining protein
MRVVLLRLVDVAALVDAGLQQHMTLEKPLFSRGQVAQNPALADLLQSEAWRVMPILRQDVTRTCSLLTANNQCGAYPAWPLSCARFPYSLDVFRGRVFYAASCHHALQDATPAGRAKEAALVEAAVDAYNQRLRDAVLVRVARKELEALGLGPFVNWQVVS